MILLVFTSTYPFDAGAEQTFLDEELPHLKEASERVILVPGRRLGTRLPIPSGIEVDTSYADHMDIGRFALLYQAMSSALFHQEILSRPTILFRRTMLMSAINFVGRASLTCKWVEKWIATSSVPARDCVFYTYWFDDAAMGIGLAKRAHTDICLVSRAHGFDLYEERQPLNYWPCRYAALSELDRLYPDSQAGMDYLSERYPEFRSRFETAFLGVQPAGFTMRPSSDGVFRIVSCSKIVPVKRVELILEGIACAARRVPEVHFEWHHFGNGELRSSLQELVNAIFPSNARGFLPGYSTQSDLFQFYRQNPVDVFVNASVSEGTPVAMMEALSCGIPVIATSVGGNREIVTSKNGLLVSSDPSPDEVASALLSMQSDPETAMLRRAGSFRVWEEKYNAECNFKKFARSLAQIRKSRLTEHT